MDSFLSGDRYFRDLLAATILLCYLEWGGVGGRCFRKFMVQCSFASNTHLEVHIEPFNLMLDKVEACSTLCLSLE